MDLEREVLGLVGRDNRCEAGPAQQAPLVVSPESGTDRGCVRVVEPLAPVALGTPAAHLGHVGDEGPDPFGRRLDGDRDIIHDGIFIQSTGVHPAEPVERALQARLNRDVTYTQTCPRCGQDFSDPDKDAVADAVVEHARTDHQHRLDREVVLAHLEGVRPGEREG